MKRSTLSHAIEILNRFPDDFSNSIQSPHIIQCNCGNMLELMDAGDGRLFSAICPKCNSKIVEVKRMHVIIEKRKII